MILPPMVAYTKNLASAKKALVDYMGIDCIQSCNVDEQCVFFTFKETDATTKLESMVGDLTYGIHFTYEGHLYKLHTQYFDI
jgi:hypothetical protein